jgi:triosephosphate isomerase
MNLDHLETIFYVQKLAWLLADSNHNYSEVEVILLPSFTNLRSMQTLVQADKLQLGYGAQNISSYKNGSYTGEISGKQLAKLGVEYSLIAHTERRNLFDENDDLMMLKATRALENNIKPILCIGELDEEPRNEPDFEFLYQQLQPIVKRIESVGKKDVIPFLEKVVIAYEPRWAVSNGKTCTPEYIQKVMSGLRGKIIETIGEEAAYKIRLVYGGSVTLNSIASIIAQSEVDGVLIGKAALDVEQFAKIVRVVNKSCQKDLQKSLKKS